MQEIPAVSKTQANPFEQLRAAALVDMSSQSRAFADFMGLLSRPASDKAAASAQKGEFLLFQDAPARAEAQAPILEAALPQDISQPVRQAVEAAPQAAQAAQAAGQAVAAAAPQRQGAQEPLLAAAKNAPVTRESFEELRPVLTRFGLSDTEIEGLQTRAQAGQLTWGQLVHTLAGRMSAAKKPVELSSSQTLDLQSMFQKLGFGPDAAKTMVENVAKGEGAKVLAQVQQKLAALPADQTLGVDSKEVATFLKVLKMPEAAANRLAKFINPDTTAAGLKGALELAGQELVQNRTQGEAQDADLLRAVAKVMKKDLDKARREAGLPTDKPADQAARGGEQPRLTVEVKAPDRNDTKWFDRHEQHRRGGEEASWRDFLSRVRGEDAAGQARAGGQAGREASIDAMLARAGLSANAQQAKAETAQQPKAWEKVAAPRLLDQVQEALLKDLGQGRKQMTLNLDPENLGKLQIMLQVRDKDVHAVIRADDPETAKLLAAQIETIKKAVEDQGLKVQSMEVQTGLSSRQEQQLFSADQHNQAQERQDLSNLFSRLRHLRAEGGTAAQEMHNAGMQAILSDQGLHIVA